MEENLDSNELELDATSVQADDSAAEPIPEIDSKYRMILLAAQRSKQLQRGADSRIATDVRKSKPTRVALEEFRQKKIRFKILEQE